MKENRTIEDVIPFIPTNYADELSSMYGNQWKVATLVAESKIKENVVEYEIDILSLDLDVAVWEERFAIYHFIDHVRRMNFVDVNLPVIVSAEGWILNGWHRIARAIIENRRYVKAIRFIKNPTPDKKESK